MSFSREHVNKGLGVAAFVTGLLLGGCSDSTQVPLVQGGGKPSPAQGQSQSSDLKQWNQAIAEAEVMAKDPARAVRAEASLKKLAQENLHSGRPLLALGLLYYSVDRVQDASAAFTELFSRLESSPSTVSISREAWYAVYQSFQRTGKENEARLALVEAVKGQNTDPGIRYDNASVTPAPEVSRLAEYLMAKELLRRGDGQDEKALNILEALVDKDGMTPKLLLASATTMTMGRRSGSIKALKKLAMTQSPEAAEAKNRLIQYGEISSEPNGRPVRS